MNVDQLTKLLEDVKNQQCEVPAALELLKTLPYEDLSYAKVDHHRELRNGYPEVIYSPGKTLNQIKGIVENMLARSTGNILASRAERDVFDTIKSITPDAIYYEEARSVVVKREEYKPLMIIFSWLLPEPLTSRSLKKPLLLPWLWVIRLKDFMMSGWPASIDFLATSRLSIMPK